MVDGLASTSERQVWFEIRPPSRAEAGAIAEPAADVRVEGRVASGDARPGRRSHYGVGRCGAGESHGQFGNSVQFPAALSGCVLVRLASPETKADVGLPRLVGASHHSPRHYNERARIPALSRWTVGLFPLLPAIASAQTANSQKPGSSDWNRVQTLSPGVATRVYLANDEAPKGNSMVKGRFSSATDTSETIWFRTGQTRTIERSLVSTVRTWRPLKKRYAGSIAGFLPSQSQPPSCRLPGQI